VSRKRLKPDIMLLDIIMVSALIDESFCKKALENGADEYITKPFDYKHLHECILVDLIMRNNLDLRVNENKKRKHPPYLLIYEFGLRISDGSVEVSGF
jgi:DNA-binding response OmpR family regulator